jgi:hypothetical protein
MSNDPPSNEWIIAIIAAIASPVASIMIAYRRYRTVGSLSSEDVSNIVQAALMDQEKKRAIIEERNLLVHLQEVEKDRRKELEKQLEECRNKYNDLQRRKPRTTRDS